MTDDTNIFRLPGTEPVHENGLPFSAIEKRDASQSPAQVAQELTQVDHSICTRYGCRDYATPKPGMCNMCQPSPLAAQVRDESLDEAEMLIESTANMMLGMTLDPSIPNHVKEAIRFRIQKLDGYLQSQQVEHPDTKEEK